MGAISAYANWLMAFFPHGYDVTTCDTFEHCIPSVNNMHLPWVINDKISLTALMFTVTLSYGDGGNLNVTNVFSFDNTDGDAVKGGYYYKLSCHIYMHVYIILLL